MFGDSSAILQTIASFLVATAWVGLLMLVIALIITNRDE